MEAVPLAACGGVYMNSADDPDPHVHRGFEAVSRQIARWVETYPDLQVEPLEIQTNGDVAFVWVRFSGHGAGSGVPIDMESAHVVTVEAGKVRRVEEYTSAPIASKPPGCRNSSPTEEGLGDSAVMGRGGFEPPTDGL
jgi:ketosteroid isomerase-like protein